MADGASHHAAPMPAGKAIAADDAALRPSAEMLHRMQTRRSVPMRAFREEAMASADIDTMLRLAARTPDHGRLVPWRFILVQGDGRHGLGEALDALYGRQKPDLDPAKKTIWADYMQRAPLTVILVSRIDPASKIPEWDQVLSAGAAGMNLIFAATALGYAAQWLLKWPGRDAEAAALCGALPGERIGGFLHIGRPLESPADRVRPDMAAIVTRWGG